MIIEVKNKGVYIPDFGDNKTLPEAEQIKVHHRYLLPGERQNFIYTEPLMVDKLKGEVDSKVKAVQDMTGIAKTIITKIEGFSVKAGSKTVKVDSVDKLYNTSGVPYALVSDIEIGMFLASPEVDVDFLSKPSAST